MLLGILSPGLWLCVVCLVRSARTWRMTVRASIAAIHAWMGCDRSGRRRRRGRRQRRHVQYVLGSGREGTGGERALDLFVDAVATGIPLSLTRAIASHMGDVARWTAVRPLRRRPTPFLQIRLATRLRDGADHVVVERPERHGGVVRGAVLPQLEHDDLVQALAAPRRHCLAKRWGVHGVFLSTSTSRDLRLVRNCGNL